MQGEKPTTVRQAAVAICLGVIFFEKPSARTSPPVYRLQSQSARRWALTWPRTWRAEVFATAYRRRRQLRPSRGSLLRVPGSTGRGNVVLVHCRDEQNSCFAPGRADGRTGSDAAFRGRCLLPGDHRARCRLDRGAALAELNPYSAGRAACCNAWPSSVTRSSAARVVSPMGRPVAAVQARCGPTGSPRAIRLHMWTS